MQQPLPPFSVSCSPNIPELLHDLRISLVLSTYQAGKIVLLSAPVRDKLMQLPRTYPNAMGITVDNDRMAIAANSEITVLSNSKQLAYTYPEKPNVYDAMYLPRASYFTGELAWHDMAWVNNKLIATNTMFSCLSHIDDEYSFKPFWKPHFITELAPEDRCHLNGIAVNNNKVEYVTALGNSNLPAGWRENKMNGGILMDVEKNSILTDNLAMPHSPRVYDDKLYLLNSAMGELLAVDRSTGNTELISKLGAFARGMDKFGDYLFVGVSKLRHNSSAFRDLPIAKTSFAGVIVIHLPMKAIVGQIKYETSVEEIYEVKVLPGCVRPNILNQDKELHKQALHLENSTYWGKIKEKNN